MKKFLLSVVLSAALSFSAVAQYTDGIFVLNEGGIGKNNSTVSFIVNDEVQNDIFATANNNAILGDTGQSLTFKDDKAYVVLNYSNKVEIVNSTTFAKIATIDTGMVNPRYIAFHGNKAYVTCWGVSDNEEDDYLAVIDLATNTASTPIPLANGVEKIITVGDKLYVAHQGGWGVNNLVSVVDTATNVVTTITVGDVPNSLIEKDGSLYVLCGGNPGWVPGSTQTGGKLVKINLADNTVAQEIEFVATEHPSNLEVNGDNFYYTIGAGVYTKTITATTLPTTSFITVGAPGAYGVYGFDIIDEKIYVGDAGDYATPGTAFVYSIEGALLDEYTVGVSPNGFYKSPESVNGIDDVNRLTVSVYPNPVSDVLYITSDKQAAVKIFDVTGRVVANELYTASGINVSALPAGTYFAEITIENARTVKQIVVQ
ncbi:hypothetical protein D3C87_244440 [compost metagenome]